jgi:hypothetical protein
MEDVMEIIEIEKPWWAIFVDIEGYSVKDQVKGRELSVLLADDICKIASKVSCRGYLGFYQFGADGFLIRPNSLSENLSLAISISIALQRMALRYNCVRKVKISYGNLGDYSDFYKYLPQKYNGKMDDDDTIQINHCLIVLSPSLMGNALIRSYNLKCPHGPLLCIDSIYKEEINELQLISLPFYEEKSISINWLGSLGKDMENQVSYFIGENIDSHSLYEKYLAEECGNIPLESEWLVNAKCLLK